MMKQCIVAIMALSLIAPLYSQEKKEADEKNKVTVWQELALEDFETTPYTEKNITYSVTSDQEAKLAIRDQLPGAPNSKKYLGIKVKSRGNDTFVIKPAKEMIIDKFCKNITFWVYGKKTYGELSFMIQDTKQVNHKLIIVPTINFLGWKKFTVNMDNRIIQEDDFINQRKTMKIVNIQYRTPHTTKATISKWHFIYLDDIIAVVRERYSDKQSDEW
ncbi:MAG: hypothetical protein JW807_03435 [Spirochaetes bacterium]|nr:hypothetical protein [Spirochaetota bacterium]